MVAKEVPIAICVNVSAENPWASNTKTSTGTTTMPPPTPNRPAVKPANIPATMYIARTMCGIDLILEIERAMITRFEKDATNSF